MLGLYLNERTNAEVNRCIVGKLDREVAPVRLVSDGDLGDGLADDFGIFMDCVAALSFFQWHVAFSAGSALRITESSN
jgi:hypothetical protein